MDKKENSASQGNIGLYCRPGSEGYFWSANERVFV